MVRCHPSFLLRIPRPPRATQIRSSAASDVYTGQVGPRWPRQSPCGSFGSRAPSLSRPRCSPRPTPRPSGRRRRRGATSAPPEHLPGGQRLRGGAGGPCEPAGATSEYSKARASPRSPARRVSLTTPPPPGSGVHRAYKMAAGRAPARLSLTRHHLHHRPPVLDRHGRAGGAELSGRVCSILLNAPHRILNCPL